jgi:hypothetical protein
LIEGLDIKVVQELLRHANGRITLDIFAQTLTPDKRDARSRVANLDFSEEDDDGRILNESDQTLVVRSRECKLIERNGRHKKMVGTRRLELLTSTVSR